MLCLLENNVTNFVCDCESSAFWRKVMGIEDPQAFAVFPEFS